MADTKALRTLIERGREAADIMAREWPGAELDGCIKELADALASLLDAEPVAWRYRDFADGWIYTTSINPEYAKVTGVHFEPLYAAPGKGNTPEDAT